METVDFDTLGQQIACDRFLAIRQLLLQKLKFFMPDDPCASIPIACRIEPQKLSLQFEESWLPQSGKLFLYMENYDLMILAAAERVSRFLQQREPWQDFDVCIFDQEITWCAALTHNDQMKFVSFTW